MKTASGTVKMQASDTLSPAVSVSPLSVTRLNRSVQNIQGVNHRPNQALDEAKNEKGTKMIHRTELELIKYTVSCFLREIASVLRCVKNKTFSDIFLNPIIVRYQ